MHAALLEDLDMNSLSDFRRCKCGEWYRAGSDEELTRRCDKCRREMVNAEQYPCREEVMVAHAGDDD